MKIEGQQKIVKKSVLEEYFKTVINEQKDNPIIKVYDKYNNSADDDGICVTGEEIFILFKNSYALIISYVNIDSFYVEYRELTREELEESAKIDCLDFFNYAIGLYNYDTIKIDRRLVSFFEYDYIENIKICKVDREYDVWEKNQIISKKPNEDTFDEVILELHNGNEIHIYPEDAENDGYTDVWTKGAKRYTQKF